MLCLFIVFFFLFTSIAACGPCSVIIDERFSTARCFEKHSGVMQQSFKICFDWFSLGIKPSNGVVEELSSTYKAFFSCKHFEIFAFQQNHGQKSPLWRPLDADTLSNVTIPTTTATEMTTSTGKTSTSFTQSLSSSEPTTISTTPSTTLPQTTLPTIVENAREWCQKVLLAYGEAKCYRKHCSRAAKSCSNHKIPAHYEVKDCRNYRACYKKYCNGIRGLNS